MLVHAVAAFEDNYIWLIQSALASRTIIVDPGDANPVIKTLIEKQLSPAAILITHHHHDHIGGIKALTEKFAIPVYGPANESISGINHPVSPGEIINIDGFEPISVMDTGGHTADHISYYSQNSLFCGDTLFAGGCGRLLGGTAAQLHTSLNRIYQLPDNTAIYCAHEYTQANLRFALAVEPENTALQQRIDETNQLRAKYQATVPSLLSQEKATNPFLRCEQSSVWRAAEKKAGHVLHSPLEVFTVIRSWKDNF